jgi:hypothetical protein cdiviTM7_00597
MNNFWVGFKNKKGIFLAILALVSFNTFFISDGDYAYAAGKNYTYTASDCKKAGLEFDKPGIGTRAGTGCVFYSTSGAIFGNKDIDATVLGSSNDLSSKMDAYTTNDSGKEPSTCLSGYKKGRYDFGQAKDVPACVKDKSHKGSSGLPSGVKESDIYDEKSCTADGGSWFFSENDHHRGEMCGFGKTLRDDGATDDWNYAMTKKQIPKEFFASSESCPKGYVKFLKTQNGKQRNACKKSSKGSDLDCTKEENKEKQECKDVEKDSSEDGDGDGSDDKNSCAIEWVGWIMCPVIRGANGMVVSTYSLMQQHFLNIKADEIFQQDKPAFKTWSSFRDIANVFFVIALSIIIFSQVSGVGISNYGIKKMLPKIIVFAILVNISWYISVIMIDISNIVGHSLFEWLSGDGTWQFSSDSQSEDSPVEQILGGTAAIGVGTAAAVTGALAAGSSILLFIFSAALALIMMIFILLIRQAAVIVLVVVSPVAFVAGILPNTEGFFKKWIKFFKNMLMIYPICSLIVGGAIFVSNLLYNNETNPLLKVAYGILPILSLFTIVAIIKSVLSIIDGLTGGNLRGTLDRMSGRLNDATANSRPMRRFKEWEGDRKIGGLAIGKNAREAKYQEGKAGRTYIKNRRELQRLQAKDNLTAAESRRYTQLGAENAKYERAQSEGMASAMASTIAGDVGAVDRHLQRISNVTDPVQQGLMYGAVAQAVNQAGLSAADRSAAMAKVVDGALQSDNPEQRQAAMRQIALNAGSEMKNINPAAAKALTQNTANKDNIKSVSDFEKDASTYAGASAQQMAGWSAMSSADSSNNQVLNAVKNAYASGDQKQISEAQNIAKVADQALKANEKGTMFLTPNQEKNFRAISAEAKANAPAAAAPATPTPAPVPAGSQNMQVGVNYNVNNNSQTSQYGAPAPTQQVAVDQYKSNRRFGPQRSK